MHFAHLFVPLQTRFKEHCLHMKKFFIFLLVAVVVVIGVLMCQGTVVQESGDGSQVTGDYRSTDSLPMLITQIRKCSKLYTAEYRVHKIVTHDDVLRLMDVVLRLRADIPDLTLHLVGGGGENEERVIQLVHQFPDCLICHGPIYDKPLLQSIYQQCSVFAMPSKKETFGLVYLEALSQGLRVLYTHGEGIDGLFEKRVGEAVNPYSEKEIEAALSRLLRQPDAYNTLEATDFEPFRWESIAQRYSEIYHHIIYKVND